MADYSTIKGFTIQSLTADPYLSEVAAGTWASANALNTGRQQAGAAGTQTAASIFGGATALTATEKYDGTNWTTSPATLNTGRKELGGVGTQDAAIAFGGEPAVTATEVFNGTTWTTSPGTLNTGRKNMSSFGTSTAAVAAQGNTPPNTANVEEWDGTSWSEETNVPESNGQGAGCGILTAGLIFGGYITAATANTFEYDGTNWTAGGGLNTARWNLAGFGTQTAGMAFGGGDPSPVIGGYTENYNGSAWTEVADAATKRETASGVGTAPAGLVMGGNPSLTTTEEFSVPATTSVAQEGQVWYNSTSNVLKGLGLTTPAGAWSSGGAINSGRMNIGYAGGSNSAMIIMGGYNASNPAPTKYYTATESYNGASWTTVNSLQSATGGLQGMGTSTAAIETGGGGGALPYIDATELWDGTSWTETGNATNAGRETFASGGSSTAAMIFGGVIGAPVTPPMYYIRNTEEYDGSSWSEKNDLNIGRQQLQASTQGTTTAMLAIAGELDVPYSPRQGLYVEEWDGTCWTEIANVTNSRTNGGGAGTSTNALRFGGAPVPGGESVYTEAWNGTSWSEVADLATGRTSAGGGNGVASSALYCGGKTLPTDTGITLCEEWAAGQAIQTFTAS